VPLADEAYRMKSDTGAIILVVEAEHLEATRGGISTRERIMGQLWPGESMPRRRAWLSVMRHIYFRVRWWYFRVRWWPPARRLFGVGLSGWRPRRSGESLLDRRRRMKMF
jgi:hypothetical protein